MTAEDQVVDVATDSNRVFIGTNKGLFAADHIRQNFVSDIYPVQEDNWSVPIDKALGF